MHNPCPLFEELSAIPSPVPEIVLNLAEVLPSTDVTGIQMK